MLSTSADTIVKELSNLGLEQDQARIYIYLLKSEAVSALQISRDLGIGRTKVYRILEGLKEKKLIEEVLDYPGRKYKAVSYEVLGNLVDDEARRVENLKNSLPNLFASMESIQLQSASKSKVIYHKGIEGIKQITWNSLKAKDELMIFEINQSMNAFTDEKFSERVREEFVTRNIVVRQLTNFDHILPFTKNSEFVNNYVKIRHIDSSKISLDFELLIYNEVVALYSPELADPFGIEIYSKDLARMQKQMFDFIWEAADPMVIGEGGEARV